MCKDLSKIKELGLVTLGAHLTLNFMSKKFGGSERGISHCKDLLF